MSKKKYQFQIGNYFTISASVVHLLLFVIAAVVLVSLKACSSPDADSADNQVATLSQDKQQNVADIEDNINNSYARLAADRVDICPKLLQKEIDRNAIERTGEVMRNDYCDYFLYPRKGQKIAITVNHSQIEALLIVPTLHNFADGDYRVESYDKHVVRLAYNGATYKPQNLSYDVSIDIED